MSSFKPFKILLLGAAGVGKIDFFEKIIKNRFAANYKLTVGAEILVKDVEFKPGKVAKLSIWDIGGQQRFEFIRSTFYKGALGIISVFDVMREQTYIETRKWLTEIRQFAGAHVPFLLIGNTANLTETKKPAIDSNEVSEFVDKEGGVYLEASPDMTLIVEEALRELTRKIVDKSMSSV
ncbi:MAG: GTP-binding protein [Candidatus Lokiarchaeota archaeon]|nr:GTP-binding protein [Candidatus Lokiarchaeota archaeon]